MARGQGRGRGPAWTAAEDAAIRAAVRANREDGFTALERTADGDGWRTVRTARLADVAKRIGRSLDAVRKRAQRIGAHSMVDHTGRRYRDQWRREHAAELAEMEGNDDGSKG